MFVHFRADEWNINKWDWEGVLRVVSKGEECSIRLEDKTTGTHRSDIAVILGALFRYARCYTKEMGREFCHTSILEKYLR